MSGSSWYFKRCISLAVKTLDDVKIFHENLFPKANIDQEKEHNQFVRAILYDIRFDKINEKNICEKQEFENSIDKKSYRKIRST